MRRKAIIIGAAGRDYHDFNTFFRGNPAYEVVAFTAAAEQNLGTIEGKLRRYPPALAGKQYPKGIPTYPEHELASLIKKLHATDVFFSYSDVSNDFIAHKAALAAAAGANFTLLGAASTMLKSKKPVISICAVRTGSGKSQTTRFVADLLKRAGKRVAVVRHPMPYGDLVKQRVQRFASYADLDKQECTIEEREEYEPHIDRGTVVFAGVDYEAILRAAEREADVVLWDGGNNDIPFYKPNLAIVVADPLRAGDELRYYHGEANVRLADIVVINKENGATPAQISTVVSNVKALNPKALVVHANSDITVDGDIRGKRVLVVEDGPTTTHGGLGYGAGYVAAQREKCEVIDPRPFAVGSIRAAFAEFPNLGRVIPAMGYSGSQVKELEKTINKSDCELVVSGTPIDLGRVLHANKPLVRVRYELKEKGSVLRNAIESFVRRLK
jgi:predicted GTPase